MSIFQKSCDEWNEQYVQPQPLSRVLVASDGNGNGCILDYVGAAIEYSLETESTHALEPHGLDGAPEGIAIWEGSMGSVRVDSPEYGEDWDWVCNGEFRDLTLYEWHALSTNQPLWDVREWYTPKHPGHPDYVEEQ